MDRAARSKSIIMPASIAKQQGANRLALNALTSELEAGLVVTPVEANSCLESSQLGGYTFEDFAVGPG